MRFNVDSAAPHYARVAGLFGVDTHHMAEKAAAERCIAEVERMIERLGITRGLRNHRVPRESLESLSRKAFADSCHKTNVRPCTEADLLRLYQESW